MSLGLLGLSGLSACTSTPVTRKPAQAAFEPVSWVELGADFAVIARVATEAESCPEILLNGGTASSSRLPMSLRAEPTPQFQIRVCEAFIPHGTKTAAIGAEALPLPKDKPHRIVIFGDSGCRIKTTDKATKPQGCNSPSAWPFPTMTEHEAALEPDLVVHLGDYLYRETPCPEGNTTCQGSPSGDNWETWRADFFEAARPLLRKAPWIFVRGNHELCRRAGPGFFRFLDPSPLGAECKDTTDPYLVQQGSAQFVVLDSASATDLTAPENLVALYKPQFAAIAKMPLKDAWIVTHKPLWGSGLPDSDLITQNQTLQAASGNKLPSGISTIFSGHIHLFMAYRFADGRPSQIIAGNGGTSLHPVPFENPAGFKIAGTTVSSGIVLDNFGFLRLESSGKETWKGTVLDQKLEPIAVCPKIGGRFHCRHLNSGEAATLRPKL